MLILDTNRRLLDQTGFALTRTTGRSMRPLIWEGDFCVAVVPLGDAEPTVGDLLVFAQPRSGKETGVVHRLIRIVTEDGSSRVYITRGDNNYGVERVRRDDIIGRVAEVHRLSGWRPWHAVHTRKFTVSDPSYLRYIRFWDAIWPLRAVYYRLRPYPRAIMRRIRNLFSQG